MSSSQTLYTQIVATVRSFHIDAPLKREDGHAAFGTLVAQNLGKHVGVPTDWALDEEVAADGRSARRHIMVRSSTL